MFNPYRLKGKKCRFGEEAGRDETRIVDVPPEVQEGDVVDIPICIVVGSVFQFNCVVVDIYNCQLEGVAWVRWRVADVIRVSIDERILVGVDDVDTYLRPYVV